MERRKFVIGAGALATGSAAAMGTGAFSMQSTDREMSVGIVGDDQGILRFQDDFASDISQVNDDGRYEVDFAAAAGDGVNPDSDVTIGRRYDSPANGPSIRIVNDSGKGLDNVGYTFEPSESFHTSDEDTWLGISVQDANGEVKKIEVGKGSTGDGSTESIEFDTSGTLGAGQDHRLALRVSTHGADVEADDLSGTLTINAAVSEHRDWEP